MTAWQLRKRRGPRKQMLVSRNVLRPTETIYKLLQIFTAYKALEQKSL